MQFLCDIRLPDQAVALTLEGTGRKPLTEPSKVIREAIEREDGKVIYLSSCNGGWDFACVFDCQTPDAQIRACMTLHNAGFITKTRSCYDPNILDRAWQNAVQHPVGATR